MTDTTYEYQKTRLFNFRRMISINHEVDDIKNEQMDPKQLIRYCKDNTKIIQYLIDKIILDNYVYDVDVYMYLCTTSYKNKYTNHFICRRIPSNDPFEPYLNYYHYTEDQIQEMIASDTLEHNNKCIVTFDEQNDHLRSWLYKRYTGIISSYGWNNLIYRGKN